MSFDTNDFVSRMIGVTKFIERKRNTLEDFREVEDYLKKYKDKLMDLDKACKDASLNNYKNIKERLEAYLSRFDMEDLPSNVDNVEKVISFLRAHESELHKISALLTFINSIWDSFIKRLNMDENDDPRFIKEINVKIKEANEAFISASFDDLSRIEVDTEKLKKEISEVINSFDFFNMTLDKYIFIGEEANNIKGEIEHFLQNDFYEDSLGELSIRRKKIERLLEIVKKEGTRTGRFGFFVVKLKRKGSSDIRTYTIKVDGHILDNQENYNSLDYDAEDTGKKIYFDEYPMEGVFERVEVAKKLKVSKSHYQAIAELDKFAYGNFIALGSIFGLMGLLTIALTLNPLIISAMVALGYFFFKWTFKLKKEAVDKKFGVPHSFFFIPVDMVIVKEGDEGLKTDNLKVTLLINDKITFLKGVKNGSNKN